MFTVAGLELELVEQLDSGDQEGDGLSRTRLGGTEDIATSQQRGDGACLNFGHLRESNIDDSLLGGFAQLERGKLIVDLLATSYFVHTKNNRECLLLVHRNPPRTKSSKNCDSAAPQEWGVFRTLGRGKIEAK